jgi:hypothetical protein
MSGRLDWSHVPFRTLMADPFDLSARIVNPGISTLTIRRNTADGTGTFFLLRRDPTQVTTGRHYSLLPAGEFQPASIANESIVADLDIWRNMVREYAEEMLGQPEHDGSGGVPVDYEVWPFYRDMTRARQAGSVRPYALGVILDALSLNSSIATATVIDDAVFDDLFRDLVATNPEGEVVFSLDNNKSIRGLPFDEDTVKRLTTREPLGQTSAACLKLAWRHRDHLLGGNLRGPPHPDSPIDCIRLQHPGHNPAARFRTMSTVVKPSLRDSKLLITRPSVTTAAFCALQLSRACRTTSAASSS